MSKEYWTISEVIEIFQVQERFIADLEEEEILCPTCTKGPPTKRFSAHDLERLRLAKILMEEMDVNLPGVEIILRMRESMIHMRKQFDDILEDLANQIRAGLIP
ncbi:MAG: MerR family transcriptional regulator [Deltaproteobacteria bacterium]|nr:MerR family transcriptional regulator [Deltaproteobacteria bacterium]